MPTKADYLAEFDALGVNPPASVKHDGRERKHIPSEASKEELRRVLTEIKRNLGTLPQEYVDAEVDAREAYAQRVSELQTALKAGDIDLEAREKGYADADTELHAALDALDPLEGSVE